MSKKRMLWSLTLLVALLVVGVSVAAAQGPADPPSAGGSISGTITAESDGSPLADIPVRALDPRTGAHRGARTDADGHYVVENLRPGKYVVFAGGNGYLPELYDNVNPRNFPYATRVEVTAGNETTGIDFALSQGGSISGAVTAAADGSPLANIRVFAVPAGTHPPEASDTAEPAGAKFAPDRDAPLDEPEDRPERKHKRPGAVTDDTGHYTIAGLPTGDFVVVAGAGSDYLPQAYSEGGTEPTPVHVNAGEETTGIGFALSAGGGITGRVTDEAGAPIANAKVRAIDPDTHARGGARTDEDGNYSISGLKTGSYLVNANAPGYLPQFYNGAADRDSATRVAVTEGSTTSGIDFALSNGGSISGVVSDEETGEPLAGRVVIAGSTETTVGFALHRRARTDEAGRYTITGLTSGSYIVGVPGGHGYAGEFYDNVRSRAEATAVEVTEGSATENINFALAKRLAE